MGVLPVKVRNSSNHKSGEVVLRDYFAEVSGLSPLTLEAKMRDLKKFTAFFMEVTGGLDLSSWLPIDSARFSSQLQNRYAPATVNRIMASLKSFGRWGRENGHWQLDPCKGIRDLALPELKPKAVPAQDLHRIRRTCELLSLRQGMRDYDQSLRNHAIIESLNSSGLRVSELLRLRLDQVEGKRFKRVLCKGGRVRDVLIGSAAAAVIQRYVAEGRKSTSPYLFVNRWGEPLTRNGLGKVLRGIANLASSENHPVKLTPHMLRHSHGYAAREAKDAVFAQRRLGHSSLRYIERYCTTPDDVEEKLVEEIS